MKNTLKIALTLIGLMIVSTSFSQNKHFDKLEMLFAQGHYKKVKRRANRLLDKPEYDYSYLPKYYRSLSLFELSQNERWQKRHPGALYEARDLFLEIKKDVESDKLFNAHMYELSWVKEDLMDWAADLNRRGKEDAFNELQEIIYEIFEGIPGVHSNDENQIPVSGDTISSAYVENMAIRDQIVHNAKQYIGVPYVWAGSTPEGFDCSGYTSYVMNKVDIKLPRTSGDQYSNSKKLKLKNVEKGDLIFFNNGSGVSHVGIVVSEKGKPVQMIHASSSKGIIITEVGDSEYWTSRIHGFGTFIN